MAVLLKVQNIKMPKASREMGNEEGPSPLKPIKGFGGVL